MLLKLSDLHQNAGRVGEAIRKFFVILFVQILFGDDRIFRETNPLIIQWAKADLALLPWKILRSVGEIYWEEKCKVGFD
jgi:hypothetical protein